MSIYKIQIWYKYFKDKSLSSAKMLLNNILRRKANWIGHILRRNFLFHDVIDGQMQEGKE